MSIIEINENKLYNLSRRQEVMTEETEAEQLVRRFIRAKLPAVLEEVEQIKTARLNEEKQLRGIIRQLLIERDIADNYPHESTGINMLEDVLKKLITTLRGDYKRLTTNVKQRESFRAHFLNAIDQSLKPVDANDMSDSPDSALMASPDVKPETPTEDEPVFNDEEPAFAMDELEEDLGIDIVDDKEKMIDVEDDKKEPDEFEEFVASNNDGESLDQTGARAAFDTHKKVGQYILDGYEKLADDKDREDFSDYLITNVKLYLDKFESELADELNEPTTLEYEKITGHA